MNHLHLIDSADGPVYDPPRREGQVERHGSLTVTEPDQRCVTAPPRTPTRLDERLERPMHPADLAAHRATRDRRDRRKLAEAVRQVALHASDADLVELERLTRLVELEQLTVDQALDIVADVRRRQQRAA